MVDYEPPPHLQLPVSLLIAYLTGPQTLPFVAKGEFGAGRGYAIDRVLETHDLTPVYLTEAEAPPSHDLDGHVLFPVYDLDKPSLEGLPAPSILLADPEFVPDREHRDAPSVYFPPPPTHEVERFLVAAGYPAHLANGNPSYASAKMAMRAWDAAKVHVSIEPPRPTGWDAFRAGGDAPVGDRLLAYYCAENLPPDDTRWNWVLYLGRHIPAWLADRALGPVRRAWPSRVRFPSILRVKKEDRRAAKAAPAEAPRATDIAPVPKTYSVDW